MSQSWESNFPRFTDLKTGRKTHVAIIFFTFLSLFDLVNLPEPCVSDYDTPMPTGNHTVYPVSTNPIIIRIGNLKVCVIIKQVNGV